MAGTNLMKEASELFEQLNGDGDCVRINSIKWLQAKFQSLDLGVPHQVFNDELLLVHFDPLKRHLAKRALDVFPTLGAAFASKRCLFVVFNVTLGRSICIVVEGYRVLFFDSVESRFHQDVETIAGIKIFLESDKFNQIQRLIDGVSRYCSSLGEYHSISRFSEDALIEALEKSIDISAEELIEIEGVSISRRELLNYDEALSANARHMNDAVRDIEFFFPEIDLSEFNPEEDY